MFFTLKLLKLGLKVVLLPFRVVAKVARWLVGFAVGQARGNASAGSRDDDRGDRPEGTPDPIRDPNRENETPVDGDESGDQSTESGPSRSASTAGGTRVGGQLLSARAYAGVLGVLAAGQGFGLLTNTLGVNLPDAPDALWVIAANPLYDVVYYPFLAPGPVGPLYTAFAVGYGVLFGWLALRVLRDGYVPARLVRPVARFFAANGALYAVMPVLIVWHLPVFGFVEGLTAFYTDGQTLAETVAYAGGMGGLYVATFQIRPRPADVSGASAASDASDERAPWAQTEDDRSRATEDGDDRTADKGTAASPAAADARDESPADGLPTDSGTPDADDTASAGADSAAADARADDEAASATEQPSVEATGAADTGTAAESEAAAQVAESEVAAEAADFPSETADGAAETADAQSSPAAEPAAAERADTETERSQPTETTNDAEAALGRLSADDADSRLAAANDLRDLAAEGHDYLTGERVADALDGESDPDVRAVLVDALAALDTAAATEALRDARFDPNPAVSDRAAEHLD